MKDDQPLGAPVPGWTRREMPRKIVLKGQWCQLEPLAEAHFIGLEAAYAGADSNWTYLTYGPFTDRASFQAHLAAQAGEFDPIFFAVVVDGQPLGMAALMRIDRASGVFEIGHLNFGPALQRTRAATEALFLLARYMFEDLDYRRGEWKCNALNVASQAAAERLGYRFEGIFRQAGVVKGRNRDTAWFSILDGEWPAIAARIRAWLSPANFDSEGRQKERLGGRVFFL